MDFKEFLIKELKKEDTKDIYIKNDMKLNLDQHFKFGPVCLSPLKTNNITKKRKPV